MKSKKNKNGILYWTRILATAIGILSVFGTVMYFVIDGLARSEERAEFIQKMNVIINENQKTYLELVEKYYSEQLTLLKELSSYKEETNSMINKTNSNIDKIHKQIDGTLIPILEDISNREIYRVDLSELIMMQNEFELLKDSLISKLEQLDKQPGSPYNKILPYPMIKTNIKELKDFAGYPTGLMFPFPKTLKVVSKPVSHISILLEKILTYEDSLFVARYYDKELHLLFETELDSIRSFFLGLLAPIAPDE